MTLGFFNRKDSKKTKQSFSNLERTRIKYSIFKDLMLLKVVQSLMTKPYDLRYSDAVVVSIECKLLADNQMKDLCLLVKVSLNHK